MTLFFFSQPVPTGHVSSYYYICVPSYKYIHILRHDSFFLFEAGPDGACVLILLYVCPHTNTYTQTWLFFFFRSRSRRGMCPHTTIYTYTQTWLFFFFRSRSRRGEAHIVVRGHIYSNSTICVLILLYIYFFFRSRSRRGEARMLYQQALEMKSDDPHTLGEFAFFLEDRCKDYTAAQVIFGNIRYYLLLFFFWRTVGGTMQLRRY